jgi:serine/threonine-protein kinase
MATVYFGRLCGPAGFAPTVAVKAPHPQYARDPEFAKMLVDEARLAARVRHPNVVSVIDVHAEGNELFLVMEYVHGEALSRLIVTSGQDGERVPPRIASAIVCGILHGLHAAHEARDEHGQPLNIVHRDVSPHNVVVGVDGVARLIDFGVAKAVGRVQSTADGQVKGKIAYMAPEQVRGQAVTRQTDVYGAAVVLWEALTGEPLFRGENQGNTIHEVLFGSVRPPSEVAAGLSRALDAVVMRGLARERTARFSSAKEMALALQAAVPAAPPPEVGDWVEAHAVDSLMDRSRRIEAMATVPTPAAQRESLSKPRRMTVTRSAALGAGAVALLGIAAWSNLRAVHRPPSSEPTAESSPSAEPAKAAFTDQTVPYQPEPEPLAPASAPPVLSNSVSAPRVGYRAVRAPSPATSSRPCSRRNADGIIEFDTDCLRRAQRP